MTDIFTVSLADILPLNLATAPNIPPVITALDPELQLLSQESLSPQIITDIDNAPPASLDHIAANLASDLYSLAPDDQSRREILKGSIVRHMHKGTAAEIVSALRNIGIEAKFIPWWKYGGRPYTFRIEADITGDYYRGKGRGMITRLITQVVNESKSARSLMEYLDTRLSFSEKLALFYGGADGLMGNAQIGLMRDNTIPANVLYYAGIRRFHGDNVIPLQRERTLRAGLYAGGATLANYSAEEWTDLDTMQELLLKFEQRIFSRIDDLERKLNAKIDTQTGTLDKKIDSVIELLRWQKVEDELPE